MKKYFHILLALDGRRDLDIHVTYVNLQCQSGNTGNEKFDRPVKLYLLNFPICHYRKGKLLTIALIPQNQLNDDLRVLFIKIGVIKIDSPLFSQFAVKSHCSSRN